MKIFTNLFPGGKTSALTMSYDDGTVYDRKLVDIFNENDIKGTFHLNSSRILQSDGSYVVEASEVKKLYAGHEVSCHTSTHPFPEVVPQTTMVNEILEDRRALEKMCGYTVRGMSYPYGAFRDFDIPLLTSCGIRYSRTTNSTNGFGLPSDFMKWHPTCHHNHSDLKGLFDRMRGAAKGFLSNRVMYVWGHSYEFNNDNNWDKIEEFCKYAAGKEDVWYATNIEIYDYITACRNLMVGVDGNSVYNPSNVSVWVTADTYKVEIKPGENKLR